jgi:hypothetical protein
MMQIPDWSEERIEALSTGEIESLLRNAKAKGAEVLVKLCQTILQRRSPQLKRRVTTAKSPLKTREAELAARMGQLVDELSKIFDLTPETALRLSRGVKHFRAHKPVSADGTAKMGGLQRTRQCLINRYISYRLRDTVISFDIWLPKGALVDQIEYHVFAPRELLPDAVGRDVLRSSPDIDSTPHSRTGKKFASYDEAANCFTDLLASVAPRK